MLESWSLFASFSVLGILAQAILTKHPCCAIAFITDNVLIALCELSKSEPIHKVNQASYIPYINLSSNCPTVACKAFVLEFWSDLT